MDTLPLPPSPDLEQYKKRAKKLVAAAKSKDDGAVRGWATEWLETLARLRGVTITPFVQGSFDRAVAAIEERVREKTAAARASDAKFTLLQHGAPLEVKNKWDGTVLDSTMHFAVFQPVRGVHYLETVEALIAGGADVRVITPYPRENKFVDELLRRL